MKPSCVVLDGFTLTPNVPGETELPSEPSWAPLSELVSLAVHPRTDAATTLGRASAAELVLTNKVPLTKRELEALPRLRYIGVLATGTNVVDLACAHERGITVTNVPGYATESVVAHVFALLLELSMAVGEHGRAVASGNWQSSPDFTFRLRPTEQLAGRTLGIVGFGSIGRGVAKVASAFGMSVVVAHSHSGQDHPLPGVDVTFAPLDEIFSNADVVSLHCPLTEETRCLVNAARLSTMKPDALLINTGRGPLIDEMALADALRHGRIGGAGLDVLGVEPPPPNHPLIGAPRCLVTPHLAWATQTARRRLMTIATENVAAFLAGSPVNVV
ncbi:MAG: D-2-hydroxyacid dehydrogenase [Polyangiaceae bacterium]